jgi:hypothetical protein
MSSPHSEELDAEWIAECADPACGWQITTAFEYKANDRADVHTATTGHKTAVDVLSLYQEPPC